MSEERSLARKLLQGVFIALLALFLLHLVAGNLILNTTMLSPVINRKPEKTLVEWQSGRTLLPGRVHVRGLRVRGQSKGQQWEFEVAEAEVRMSLLALVGKTVRITQAHGTGFDFRMRPRLTEETKDDPTAVNFPEIEGLSNPPDPAPEDIYKAKKKTGPGWHLDISDMYFDGPMSLWIGSARMSGTGDVAGDLDFVIRRQFHMPRIQFDLEGGEIALGKDPFVADLDITIDATLGPFDPREVKGMAVLDYLLGSQSFRNGEIRDLGVVNAYIPGTGTLQVIEGRVDFGWAFDKPSKAAGSSGELTVRTQDAAMRIAGREVAGDLDLHTKLVKGSLREGNWQIVDTTLALDNMILEVITDADDALPDVAPEDRWWGHFTIHAGSVDMGDPSTLSAQASFALKNTQPLLELFLAKPTGGGDTAKVPKWVRLIPDIEDLGGKASLRMDGDGSILDDVVVRGDKFDLLARLTTHGEESDGILYVRYKGLDLGLQMEDGKSDLKVLRPKKWFLEQLGPEDEEMRAIVEERMRGGGEP
jgi:hypothetical protein